MMCPVTYSQVAACTIIILQIWSVTALTLKNVSTQIIACEDEKVQLKWEYELNPNENVNAKTWSYTKNEKKILIARWMYKDGLILEPNFINTVAIIGNDSIIIRNITTKDGGTYTLTLFLRQSSEPTTKLSLNLTVLQPPLTGCCKPTIQRLENGTGLRANLDPHACGTGPFQLKWNNASGTTSDRDVLIFLAPNMTGRFTVCVTGLSTETCFKGKRESLCQDENIEEIKQFPQTTEQNIALIAGLSIGGTILALTVILVILIKVKWRRIQKYRSRNEKWKTVRATLHFEDDVTLFQTLMRTQEAVKDKEVLNQLGENAHQRIQLLETILDVKFLTKELVHIYKEHTQFQKADSQINLQTEIWDGSSIRESDMDINNYRNVFERNQQLLKRILIQGEVGCGKTTWCNALTQEWRKAHDPYNQELNDNITFLQEYKLLFNITLGKVQKFANIDELLLCLHISVFDQLNINVYDYIKNHKTIIIIQGLDECTEDPSNVKEILSDRDLEHTVVIITSTPSIWTRYYQGTLVDRAIHVKGLKKDEMIKRAQTILKDDHFPQEVIEEFFKSVKSNDLEEFTTEHVFFPFLVDLWKMNCKLPKTRSEFLIEVLENQFKGKVLSLPSSADDYRFSFENSIVLKDKQFIKHCGKIVKFLGEIAFNILIDSTDGTTLSKQEFDDIFKKQNLTANESCQFIINFCVSINLVSIESNDEGVIRTISFRHKVMLMFLAAIYISTLKEDQIQPYSTLIESSNDLKQFVRFVSNLSKD